MTVCEFETHKSLMYVTGSISQDYIVRSFLGNKDGALLRLLSVVSSKQAHKLMNMLVSLSYLFIVFTDFQNTVSCIIKSVL